MVELWLGVLFSVLTLVLGGHIDDDMDDDFLNNNSTNIKLCCTTEQITIITIMGLIFICILLGCVIHNYTLYMSNRQKYSYQSI